MAGKRQKQIRDKKTTDKFFRQLQRTASHSPPPSNTSNTKSPPSKQQQQQQPLHTQHASSSSASTTTTKPEQKFDDIEQRKKAFLGAVLAGDDSKPLQEFAQKGEDPLIRRKVTELYAEAGAVLLGWHARTDFQDREIMGRNCFQTGSKMRGEGADVAKMEGKIARLRGGGGSRAEDVEARSSDSFDELHGLDTVIDGEATARDESVGKVVEGKTKKKRKKRRRKKAKKKRSTEDEEQQADSGYTTAPEIRPASAKPQGRAGRFTEDFSQRLEFGSAGWDEGAQLPWNSDVEKERLKQGERRERQELVETENNEQAEGDVEDEEQYLDPDILDELSNGDHLQATIANLDRFTKNVSQAEARLGAIREQIEKETAAAKAAFSARGGKPLHKTRKYFDNIIDKKASLLASMVLLNFDNHYTLLEKRWGLVAERVSRGENQLARALVDDYWDPYPISMLEALNEPSICAKKLHAPKPRLMRDWALRSEGNSSPVEALSQFKRLRNIIVKEAEVLNNAEVEEETKDWFGLFGEVASSQVPEYVRQAMSDFEFVLCTINISRSRLFKMRDRAKAAITTWLRAQDPAWSIGRKHWREIPVTTKYEYHRNEFFAMYENVRILEHKLLAYFTSEAGRTSLPAKARDLLKIFWSELDKDAEQAAAEMQKRWTVTIEALRPRFLTVDEIFMLLNDMLCPNPTGSEMQYRDLEPYIERWKLLGESESMLHERFVDLVYWEKAWEFALP